MKTKYNNKKNIEKLLKQSSTSFEDTNHNQKKIPNNLKLLIDRNISKNDFYNKDNGKILNVDYIPKELFASFINNNNNQTRNNHIDQNSLNKFATDNDFKIYNNDINISESLKKSEYISSSNVLSNNQNINPNLHLNTNISKETFSNKRYNEEININNSTNKNINLNNNMQNNEKANADVNNNNNNIISNESSTLRNDLSNCNGLSDNFINSKLNISNTLTNNSNLLSPKNEHYLDKIKLRELENKENFLFELEKKRNKNFFDIIENQKIEFLRKVKEIEKNNMKKNNDYFFKENNNIYNNDIVNIKEKEENKNLNKNNEIFSYFNKMKQENNKHKRNSNRSMAFNHKTSSSFYNNRTNIFNPFISSAKTDINNNNNLNQNKSNSNISTSKMRKSQKKKKSSKSSNKLSISKKSVKSLQSNDNYYNQATSSFKVLNSIRNSNKNISQSNYAPMEKRKNKFINSKGKEKIHDKYNTYFNCFVSDLYEKQKEKLINEKKIKIKKAKSTIKIKKLEDYIGPNLYNEQVDAPDFGYICYKANKKINPNYSLNNPLSSYYNEYDNNIRNVNRIKLKINNWEENKEILNDINLRNIYNKYENEKNNTENDIIYYEKFNNNNVYNVYRNKNTLFQDFQNCPKTEYKEETLMNNTYYNTLYNKAFNQFKNYPYNIYHEQEQIFQNNN